MPLGRIEGNAFLQYYYPQPTPSIPSQDTSSIQGTPSILCGMPVGKPTSSLLHREYTTPGIRAKREALPGSFCMCRE